MKILIVSEFIEGCLGLSYFEAFNKSGCETYKFDLLYEYQKANPLKKNKFADRFLSGFFYKSINEKLIEDVNHLKPELVFVIKGHCILPDAIKQIKESSSALIVNFNPDNPFNLNIGASSNLIRKSIPDYDCYFIWGKFLLMQLKALGAKRVEYLPFAYDPMLHYPVEVSSDERKFYGSDIAFIGSWDKEREYWLKFLTGYDLAIWGNGWKKLAKNSPLRLKWKEGEVVGKEFARVCSSSKIILNLVRKQNANAHNMRTFEVPAAKGFMLSTRTEEVCNFFEEDKDISCFETPSELKEKIDKYLVEKDLREAMCINANKKVQKHTYVERVKKVLDVCSELKRSHS